MIKPQTLKGFRDFLPQEAKKRQYVINTLKSVFELYGFEPLETPALEYDEILTGKYGDEGEKLMYRFEDNGGRKVAMRYDQTVPTARVVAQYQNELPMPFKRYQIQSVWRAENTQKGRYREFLQCDVDTFGVSSPLSDAEIVITFAAGFKKLGFNDIKILLNDRKVFEGLPMKAIIIIDKLKKIGKDGVCEELVASDVTKDISEAKNLLQSIIDQQPTLRLKEIFENLERLGITKDQYEFSPTLARGLDYYTELIFEIESPDYPYGSLGGGGRFDKLIGMFSGRDIPAVGYAIGFDRTVEAMEALNLFPKIVLEASAKVLVTIFNKDLINTSLDITTKLRSNNINTEIYLGEIKDKNPLEKQLKYADQKKIPYVIIIGPEEMEKDMITLKNLQTREQKQISIEEVIKLLL